jgi:hypothetical protein
MIKLKKIIFILFILLVLFSTEFFHVNAINGHISINYDTLDNYSNGELYIYQDLFNDRLRIAGRFKCNLVGYTLKGDLIPAGVPASQVYNLEIEYSVFKNTKIIIAEGCKHYFVQSRYTKFDDVEYMNIGIKYEF